MNKTAIKNFAIWARNKLIADISFQAGLAGITDSGIATELPQSSGNVKFYDIGTKDPVSISGEQVQMRQRLVEAIREKETEIGYKEAFRFVVEKVAYTWFNRLIAIRFMEVNDYLPGRVRVLSSENQMKAEPDIVTSPFDSDLTFTDQEKKSILLMKDENRLDELFRFLFIRQCHELHKALPALFDEGKGIDRKDSYLELLLSISFTDKDGVLWHLVHDVPEDDFNVEKEGQVEIIGWMYQYYNTELNAMVYDGSLSKEKITKDLLPAATTIYTPDWAIRYMVQNSLGRLWLEGHPNEDLKKNWKYYLEEAEQEPEVQKQLKEIRKGYAAIKPEQIKVIDPCSGSGHILVYLFDVLMQIYESQGWTQREAAQCIIENNLYGLDIDDRAAQLAFFAVMMKARQYDRRFLERGIVPHVYGIQESNGINRKHIKLFGKGMSSLEKNNAFNQLNEMLDVLHDAKEYGSILNVPELDLDLLRRFTVALDESGQMSLESIGADETLERAQLLIDQVQVMAQEYNVIVTNPPYLGSNRFSPKLDAYVKADYPDVKSDLSMVLYQHALDRMVCNNGFVSFITTSSWMFLSSFEKLRAYGNNNATLSTIVDYGTELFDGKVGHNPIVSWTIRKSIIRDYVLTAIRLVDYCYSHRDEKETQYFNIKNRYTSMQDDYAKIPGSPVAYWVSDAFLSSFVKGVALGNIADSKQGIATADNNHYLRLWYEVNKEDICFNCISHDQAKKSKAKWFPYNKGGDFRKWYGNNDYIVNWFDDGYELRHDKKAVLRNPTYYFRECISWSLISSSVAGFRYKPIGHLFDVAGMSCFSEKNLMYLLALCNSNVVMSILRVLAPTINYQCGDIANIPVIFQEGTNVELVTQENISISKSDWDSSETSWDFQRHPLLLDTSTVAEAYASWEKECNKRFERLKANEEELNQVFINIYNMKDELTPEVADKDVSVRCADLLRDIRSLISYAVGCMFGRYSLDMQGLVFAGGVWDDTRYSSFIPDADNCIPITDEPYFEDDIVGRFVDFIRTAYGSDKLEDNLDFIAKALGNKGNTSREVIRNYFLNDFMKDHIRIYQKRPIYWLFDSGKQNGFKALVYMHRWNADTFGNLRVEYLHRTQRVYEKEIERMQDIIDNSRDNREVNQASKRREKLVKQLKEARDYDVKIAHAALSRVEIDLDDGVKMNYEKVQKGPDGKSLGILAKI